MTQLQEILKGITTSCRDQSLQDPIAELMKPVQAQPDSNAETGSKAFHKFRGKAFAWPILTPLQLLMKTISNRESHHKQLKIVLQARCAHARAGDASLLDVAALLVGQLPSVLIPATVLFWEKFVLA